ncbi:ribonuclease hi large subunit, putative [Eimeria necatrix]|uniref:Ribonuclease n=1 Tax=Eimeria necatrix TaxID=51315 RepID=U6MNM1_9EIME|nr:ribonuclease hi large subunit, putative [Eimeria necatrix]CDJ64668.1 ribonuclease hi large subunit, putative [Eimeria necatrix]
MFEGNYESNFTACGGKEVFLGIDEAGRGCVLGAMVYACFYCPPDELENLKAMKVDDSKKLTEEQREAAFEAFMKQKDAFGWRIHSISPQEISAKMLRKRKVSLNDISHDAAADLIAAVCKEGVRVTQVFVDTVGKADLYEKKLQRMFPSVKITVREKADSLFPVVSAASILAKVTRDRALRLWPSPVRPNKRLKQLQLQQLQNLQQEQRLQQSKRPKRENAAAVAENSPVEASEDEPEVAKETVYGTGYPGDRVTITFLKEYMDPVFGFPELVRWSWQTAKELFEKEGMPTVWYEEVEDEEGQEGETPSAKQSRITSFFQLKPKSGAVIDRPKFFVRNRIELITAASRL